jgi:hypothetical protein
LAKHLHADEQDLQLIIPTTRLDDLANLRAVMQTLKDKYFIIGDDVKNLPESWTLSKAARYVHEEFELKIERERREGVSEAARVQAAEKKKAIEEQKIVNAAEALKRAMKQERITKRQASGSLPDADQRSVSVHRWKAIERAVGLQGKVDTSEVELFHLYDQRDAAIETVNRPSPEQSPDRGPSSKVEKDEEGR